MTQPICDIRYTPISEIATLTSFPPEIHTFLLFLKEILAAYGQHGILQNTIIRYAVQNVKTIIHCYFRRLMTQIITLS